MRQFGADERRPENVATSRALSSRLGEVCSSNLKPLLFFLSICSSCPESTFHPSSLQVLPSVLNRRSPFVLPPVRDSTHLAAMATFGLLQGLKENTTTFISTAANSQQMLYSTINPAQLSFLERLWHSYYSYFSDPVLATGIMSFFMHEVSRGTDLRAVPQLTASQRSSTSADVSLGSQSIPYPTSKSGSYSL